MEELTRAAALGHVLLDTTGVDATTEEPLWPPGQRTRVLTELEEAGLEVLYEAQGVYLLGPGG